MEPSTSDTFADNITYFSHNSGSFVYDDFGINGGYEPYGTDSICNRHSKHDYEIPEQVCQGTCIVFKWINYWRMRVFCFHICEIKQQQHYFRLFSLQVNSNKSWAKNNCLMERWHLRTAYDKKKLIAYVITLYFKQIYRKGEKLLQNKTKQNPQIFIYMHIVYLHNFHHFFNIELSFSPDLKKFSRQFLKAYNIQ